MERKTDINSFTQRILLRITLLLAAFHAAYLVLFIIIGQNQLAWFNVGSVILYLSLIYFIQNNRNRETIICVHVEVCTFTFLAVLFLGWEYGFQYLLVCIAAFCYFSFFKSRYTSYIIAFLEMLVFIGIYLLSQYKGPLFPSKLANWEVELIFLFNVLCTFGVIIYVTFISSLSDFFRTLDLRKQNFNLRNLADTDPLTGLLNRRGMQENLDQIYEEYQNQRIAFAIVIGDIDDFKEINDTFGHDCGDHVLRTLGEILQGSVRGKDSVCRWGGEEFLILLYGVDTQSAFDVVERLRKKIEHTEIIYEKEKLHITLSFGGFIQGGRDSIESMIKKADEALYMAKNGGKNRTRILK